MCFTTDKNVIKLEEQLNDISGLSAVNVEGLKSYNADKARLASHTAVAIPNKTIVNFLGSYAKMCKRLDWVASTVVRVITFTRLRKILKQN